MYPYFLPAFAEQLSSKSLFRRVRSVDKEVQSKLADRASKLEAKLHHANEMLKNLKDAHEAATKAESYPPVRSVPISRKPDPTACGSSSVVLTPHKSFQKTTTFQVQTGIQKAIARLDSKSNNEHHESESDDVADGDSNSDESESSSEDKTVSSNSDVDEDSSESGASSSPS